MRAGIIQTYPRAVLSDNSENEPGIRNTCPCIREIKPVEDCRRNKNQQRSPLVFLSQRFTRKKERKPRSSRFQIIFLYKLYLVKYIIDGREHISYPYYLASCGMFD